MLLYMNMTTHTCGQPTEKVELANRAGKIGAGREALVVGRMAATVDGDPAGCILFATERTRMEWGVDVGEHVLVLKREHDAPKNFRSRPPVDPDVVRAACRGPIQQVRAVSEQLAQLKRSHGVRNKECSACFVRAWVYNESYHSMERLKILLSMFIYLN